MQKFHICEICGYWARSGSGPEGCSSSAPRAHLEEYYISLFLETQDSSFDISMLKTPTFQMTWASYPRYWFCLMWALVDTFGSKIWGSLSRNPCLDFNGKYAKPGWSRSIGPIVLTTIHTLTFKPEHSWENLSIEERTYMRQYKSSFFRRIWGIGCWERGNYNQNQNTSSKLLIKQHFISYLCQLKLIYSI